MLGSECRCGCHAHTQQLLKKKTPKADPRGGVRRRLTKAEKDQMNQEARQLQTGPIEIESNEVHNTCPKCGAHAKPTDSFCRRDGTRLMVGKSCLGCQAPLDGDDLFCWACGLKAGAKPPESASPIPVELNQPENPRVDRLELLRAKARELGLIKETVV